MRPREILYDLDNHQAIVDNGVNPIAIYLLDLSPRPRSRDVSIGCGQIGTFGGIGPSRQLHSMVIYGSEPRYVTSKRVKRDAIHNRGVSRERCVVRTKGERVKNPRTIFIIATAFVTVVAISLAVVSALGRVSLHIDLGEPVTVGFKGAVPFRTTIEKPVEVAIDEQIEAGVSLGEKLSVPLKENLEIPLKFSLDVPVDSDFFVDQTIALSLEVPLETVLTEREIDLSRLEIPLNTEVFVDDVLDLSFTVSLDTEVKTLLGATVPVKGVVPINARVPIRQKVRIADTVYVGVKNLRAPLKMVVPIKVNVPLKQNIRVKGNIRVPIKQTITVPIEKKIDVSIPDPLPVSVKFKSTIPVRLNTEIDSTITIDEAVPVKLGTLKIKREAVRIGYK